MGRGTVKGQALTMHYTHAGNRNLQKIGFQILHRITRLVDHGSHKAEDKMSCVLD